MTFVKWIGVGVVSLFAITVAMLTRASKGVQCPPDTGPRMEFEKAKALTPDWTNADFVELDRIARHNRMSAADLLLVLASESGLKPQAANRNAEGFPIAVGLNQLTSSANALVGISEAERLQVPTLPVSEQLPLIDRFFAGLPWTKAGKSYDHAGLVYEGNFAPSIMLSKGTSPETVLYTRGKDGVYYDRNSGFDTAKKGTITVGDLIEHLRHVSEQPVYRAGLRRLQDAVGDLTLAPCLPTE